MVRDGIFWLGIPQGFVSQSPLPLADTNDVRNFMPVSAPSAYHYVWPLAVGQTLIWASVFYLFPALFAVWEADGVANKTVLSAVFTASLLVAAVFSRAMGRIIDTGTGPGFMIGGFIAAALLLLALSQAQSVFVFGIIWLALGVCMALSLYEPCFAIITRHLGLEARSTITQITLIAGFAGTVGLPLANWLAHAAGWRVAVLSFAALVLCVALPLTLLGLRNLVRCHPVAKQPIDETQTAPNTSSSALWRLGIAFALVALNHGMVLTHLLPLLAERGVSTALAVGVASLIGPMQVAGRVVLMSTQKHVSTPTTAMVSYSLLALASLLLAFAGAELWLILMFVFLQGAGWGVTSIIRPVFTREVLGGAGFGKNSGTVAAATMFATAMAPLGGAVFWQIGGYSLMLGVACAGVILGCALLWSLPRTADDAAMR